MAHYRAEHRTAGCRITHMIGVPSIVASLPMLGWNWRIGLAMFIVGWILQFSGHRYFERNKPVLMANPKNPLTYLSALIFVMQEWLHVVTGHGLAGAPTGPSAISPRPPDPRSIADLPMGKH
jgi:uncharacterized membrane protein YGL010W